MVSEPDEKLIFDAQLVDVYLAGLQSEVEAKLRRVAKFREHMQKIDAAGGATNREARVKAAKALVHQVAEMLQTNLDVRETLLELETAAKAVLEDVEQL